MEEKNIHRLRQLHQETEQILNEALSQFDLTASQGCAMGFLSHQEMPPVIRDFEEAYHLSHSCAAGIMNRLAKKKFIALETDPYDRRCKRIFTLPKGEACHGHMHEAIDAIDEQITRGFTPEEREIFAGLLDRAIANMKGALPPKIVPGKHR